MTTDRKLGPVVARALIPATLGVIVLASALAAAPAGVRSIFLNGVDISAARSQELKNVDVRINDNGDLFIVAPHYQVNEEDTYVPLSKYAEGLKLPKHKAPQAVGETQNVGPGTVISSAPIPKAGEPMSPPAGTQGTANSGPGGTQPKSEDPPPPPLPGDDAATVPVSGEAGAP